ncbi:FecR domain-containing protein [Magnetospirillum sp. UT-4]|uniref:FecR family protein n=1 Tax=Magnetospirillum sp. UT-4 TaxID=2681467 RepID=UPI00157230A7|nr:FecR family protein [Magnetospirillum sp. UT-4]
MAEPVGTVVRLQGAASAGEAALAAGSPVEGGVRLRTGDGARMEIRFVDGTLLTLGAGTELVVESFAYNAAERHGDASLRIDGPFLLASGGIAALPDKPLRVATPVAVIGIRGTRFWGGPLDNPLDVLLLDGAIRVTTPGGSVDLLQPMEGTDVRSAGAPPSPPGRWGAERVGAAFRSVAFE